MADSDDKNLKDFRSILFGSDYVPEEKADEEKPLENKEPEKAAGESFATDNVPAGGYFRNEAEGKEETDASYSGGESRPQEAPKKEVHVIMPEKKEKSESFFKRLKAAKKPSPLYYLRETLSYILIFLVAVAVGLFINIYIFRLSRVNGTSMYPTLKSNQLVTASRLPVVFNSLKRGDVIIFDHTGKARTLGDDLKQAISDNAITALFKKSENETNHTFYIKRIIGIEGDVIKIYNGKVYRTTLKNLGRDDYMDIYKDYLACTEDYEKTNSQEAFSDLANAKAKYLNQVQAIYGTEPDDTWELLEEPYVNPEEEPKYTSLEGKCWICGTHEVFVMGDNRNHSTDSRVIGVRNVDCVIGKVIGNY